MSSTMTLKTLLTTLLLINTAFALPFGSWFKKPYGFNNDTLPAVPTGGFPTASGGFWPFPTGTGFPHHDRHAGHPPFPTGGFPMPTGGFPAPTGFFPAPTGFVKRAENVQEAALVEKREAAVEHKRFEGARRAVVQNEKRGWIPWAHGKEPFPTGFPTGTGFATGTGTGGVGPTAYPTGW